jgi:hypothetical protein
LALPKLDNGTIPGKSIPAAPGTLHFHAGGDSPKYKGAGGINSPGGKVTIRKVFVNSTMTKNESAAYIFDGTAAGTTNGFRLIGTAANGWTLPTDTITGTGVSVYWQSIQPPKDNTIAGKITGNPPDRIFTITGDAGNNGYKYQGGMGTTLVSGKHYLGFVYKLSDNSTSFGDARLQIKTTAAAGDQELALLYFDQTLGSGKDGNTNYYSLVESAGGSSSEPPPVITTVPASITGPVILAHYMPWYDGPSTSAEAAQAGNYGLHWKGDENQASPPNMKSGGQVDIFASHYPLTGAYHGSSTALLEYQASLMKIAGIDGVIFDWYGTLTGQDYPQIHGHTQKMVAVLKRAGLKFAICYEDRTLDFVGGATVANAKRSFDWMEENWFKDEAYVKIDGRPVVLNFGPFSGFDGSQWNQVFAGMSKQPIFVVLPHLAHLARPNSTAYNWPAPLRDVTNSGSATPRAQVDDYLDAYLVNFGSTRYKVFTVFGGFVDIYRGLTNSTNRKYGEIAFENGAVWDSVWNKVMAAEPHVVQIATWNDYGEGTIIEPTMEWLHAPVSAGGTANKGYEELLKIQKWVKQKNPNHPYTAQDLRRPLEVYKRHYSGSGSDTTATAATNQLFNNGNLGNASSAQSYRTATDAFITEPLGNGEDPKADLRPILRN